LILMFFMLLPTIFIFFFFFADVAARADAFFDTPPHTMFSYTLLISFSLSAMPASCADAAVDVCLFFTSCHAAVYDATFTLIDCHADIRH